LTTTDADDESDPLTTIVHVAGGVAPTAATVKSSGEPATSSTATPLPPTTMLPVDVEHAGDAVAV
jgi:hypothetical protein